MKSPSILRIFGGAVLLLNLWLIGHYNLTGIPVLLLTVGFAIAYELLIVRPFAKGKAQPRDEKQPYESVTREVTPTFRPALSTPTVIDRTTLPLAPSQLACSQNTIDEDRIYTLIAEELESGRPEKGLWTRAYAECGGDEKETRVYYIKQRAARLIANERSRLAQMALEQRAQADKLEKIRQESGGIVDARLESAVSDGNWAAASKLLREGVKPIGVDDSGNSLLDLARRKEDAAMIHLLQSHGDDKQYRARREAAAREGVWICRRCASKNGPEATSCWKCSRPI